MSGPAVSIVAWQRSNGRHDLPWQRTRDPYRVWLSEIMLQQTQVKAVVGYYERFLARCPDVFALARASSDEVMALWAGLGYYSRARNLHACAKTVVERYGGRFPESAQELAELPGIGRSTAAAIAAFCFAKPEPILDGNVKRVLARAHAVHGWPGNTKVQQQLWGHAQDWMDALMLATPVEQRAEVLVSYTQGLMDLGATLCTARSPQCDQCPVQPQCQAHALGLEAAIPSPKPSRSLPTRHCVMWIVRTRQSLLLERQPAPGIWGGLWVPPRDVVPDDPWPPSTAQLERMAQGRGLDVVRTEAVVAHGFSHFKLLIAPVVAVPASGIHESEPGEEQRWFAHGALDDVGLPAPVRKLLARLAWNDGR